MQAEYLYLSYSAVEFWAYKELEVVIDGLVREAVASSTRLDDSVSGGGHESPHASKTFLCGMVAGSMATALTYPSDLLRTRFAMEGRNKVNKKKRRESKARHQNYGHLIDMVLSITQASHRRSHIYTHEGIRGFYARDVDRTYSDHALHGPALCEL